jgi:hypothetical protein
MRSSGGWAGPQAAGAPEALTQAGFLTSSAEGRRSFVHSIVRDAVYRELTEGERRRRRGAVAEALVGGPPNAWRRNWPRRADGRRPRSRTVNWQDGRWTVARARTPCVYTRSRTSALRLLAIPACAIERTPRRCGRFCRLEGVMMRAARPACYGFGFGMMQRMLSG